MLTYAIAARRTCIPMTECSGLETDRSAAIDGRVEEEQLVAALVEFRDTDKHWAARRCFWTYGWRFVPRFKEIRKEARGQYETLLHFRSNNDSCRHNLRILQPQPPRTTATGPARCGAGN